MEKRRDSSIQLLRIIAMLMVIGVHIFLYGKYFDMACKQGGLISSTAHFMKLLFRPAVNIFILITGYFLVHTPFDLKKSYRRLLPLYGAIYFYSVVLGLLALLPDSFLEPDYPPAVIVWKMLLPLSSQEWYFFTDYFLLCFFAPFLNIVLQKISKRQYQFLVVLSTLVISIWQNLFYLEPYCQIFNKYGYGGLASGKNVFCFLYIYMLGAYIGLYWEERDRPRKIYLLGALAGVGLNYLTWVHFGEDYNSVAINYTNLFVILTAVFLLLFFKDWHFYHRGINLLASATMGIYALHEAHYIRDYLWRTLSFEKQDCSRLDVNLLRILLLLLSIFFAGAAIELARKQLFRLVGRSVRSLFGDKEDKSASSR